MLVASIASNSASLVLAYFAEKIGSRVVHQDVDGAIVAQDSGDRAINLGHFGQVCGEGARFTTNLADRISDSLALARGAVDDRDLGPLGGVSTRNRFADAL